MAPPTQSRTTWTPRSPAWRRTCPCQSSSHVAITGWEGYNVRTFSAPEVLRTRLINCRSCRTAAALTNLPMDEPAAV
ncbi:hypothetical protein GA0115260_105372 [Streptomyces sp. MnatMP-M27]|nr:hypothetical protein GA0115260_105372 [Streptomyces sp. MnatMP-M27]